MSKNPKVIIRLTDGREIHIDLSPETAPITVENFLRLVNEKYYDGLCFHRVIDNFMIQGGGYCIKGGRILEAPPVSPIIGEFLSNGYRNDLKHTEGVISMARTNIKNSASSQFFICSADCGHLDGAYAAFGKTSDAQSLKVVKDIAAVTTKAVGMFCDFPSPAVVIESIREI